MATTTSQDVEQGPTQPLLGNDQDAGFNVDHWSRRVARIVYTSFSHLGASLLFGLVTSVCLKAFGHAIALALMILFIGFLVLAYYGFVNMNWASLGTVVGRNINVRRDGNVSLKDVSDAFTNIFTWTISWGMISVVGFAVGFYIGWLL
ncbi:hypothetical protein CEUSTIGMA_g6941.t1 [Chlamydomonas eustigma]|uniref:Uncharacterized protein n=1 Tax=Chlamydomonas eustigma TaxID=1157962 RepID=A0A250X9Q2_9CHLO|nr:hypothetical protein CEUSTIGMA_g6941.t1 [Chlamydomonas eustigma]|eukprot:GAX79500.1 hypothetical protein CEUSTIGMA_g6941.t1 [Chlamydomonas eustigma]